MRLPDVRIATLIDRVDAILQDVMTAAAETEDRGIDTPVASGVSAFVDLGLSDPVLRAIAEKGYREPTPI